MSELTYASLNNQGNAHLKSARRDFAHRDDRSVWRSCISDHPWHRWRPLLVRAGYALLRFCTEQQPYAPEPPPPRFRTRVVQRDGLRYVEIA